MKQQAELMLARGKPFPEIQLNLLTGENVLFPGQSGGKWSIFLLYCGSSCPTCRQQLADFQRMIRESRRENVRVVAASADDRSHAALTTWDLNISFPVAYGVDARQITGITPASSDKKRPMIQGSGFLLNPEGKVVTALYGVDQCRSNQFRSVDWFGLVGSG